MKVKSIIPVLLTLLAFQSFGQDTIAQFQADNNKWGYIKINGDTVVKPIYRYSKPFKGGMAKIGDINFINSKGEELVTTFKIIEAREFNSGLVAVNIKGKWGYMNKRGIMSIPNKYTACKDFNDGYAITQIRDQYFVIDINGNETEIIYPKCNLFTVVKGFQNNRAMIRCGDLHGFINEKGEVAVEPAYAKVSEFNGGMAWFRDEHDKIGFINKQGEVVIEPKFKVVNNFYLGLATARLDKEIGYINKQGEWVIKPQFYYAGKFDSISGLARIKDKQGQGYLNRKGEIKRNENIDGFKEYSEGYCLVRNKEDKTWRFIDVDGNELKVSPLEGMYENLKNTDYFAVAHVVFTVLRGKAKSFKNGHVRANYKNKWGVINTKGKWVIKPEHRYIKEFFIVN
jgi:hypothetical protein